MSDLHACVICTRQQTHRMACVDCTERIREQLTDLPELYVLAMAEYLNTGSGGSGTAVSIGVNVSALDGRAPLAALIALEAWEREWRESLPTFAFPSSGDDDADERAIWYAIRQRKAARWANSESDDLMGVNLCGVVEWLCTHLEAAALTHPAIDEFAREVADLHHTATLNAGEGDGGAVTKVKCPADVERDGEVQPCGVLLTLDGEHCTCPKCGTGWDRPRLMLVARASGSDIYAPIGVLAEHFAISERTIRRWREQGLVRRKGSSYHHGDIVDVIEGRTGVAAV